jgi:hypothetical protein
MPGGVMSRHYCLSKSQLHSKSGLPGRLSYKIHGASNDEMKTIFIAALPIAASSLTYAPTDSDTDNAGQWDSHHGFTDPGQ